MLLRNSISNTKKFFQRTIHNVKSFLSKGGTYEKLPKTTNIEELDNFYVEFTHQWDSQKGTLRNQERKNPKNTQNSVKKNVQTYELGPRKAVDGETERNIKDGMKSTSSMSVVRGFRPMELSISRSVREKRLDMFSEKLKELEKIDKGNIIHKMDIEEILHYYSCLTCPPYIEMVDKFFKEICTEFLCT
ncbi:hypothetical protein RND81_08G055300 [Saponaria officinalis]|uniref:OVATE domain-containing protein n=1 Tax=Saponaria officinalis TaxID=3572 RepID=A0AAW1J450_SAPOF